MDFGSKLLMDAVGFMYITPFETRNNVFYVSAVEIIVNLKRKS
jgi:hypothetical protein